MWRSDGRKIFFSSQLGIPILIRRNFHIEYQQDISSTLFRSIYCQVYIHESSLAKVRLQLPLLQFNDVFLIQLSCLYENVFVLLTGLSSQKATNVKLWCFFLLLIRRSYWTISRDNYDLRRRDAHVTSIYRFDSDQKVVTFRHSTIIGTGLSQRESYISERRDRGHLLWLRHSTTCLPFGRRYLNIFSWVKMSAFRSKFHQKCVPMGPNGLYIHINSPVRRQVITQTNDDPCIWHHMVLLHCKELMHYRSCHVRVNPDSKVHGANLGPTWGRQDPVGPHVGHVNLAIWECAPCSLWSGAIWHAVCRPLLGYPVVLCKSPKLVWRSGVP